MRANVLNDPALVKRAGQFAWLSIDSDRPSNAAFVNKFATGGVPLFVVIDPAKGKAVLNWYGTATAQQLAKLLEDGERAMAGAWRTATRIHASRCPAKSSAITSDSVARVRCGHNRPPIVNACS